MGCKRRPGNRSGYTLGKKELREGFDDRLVRRKEQGSPSLVQPPVCQDRTPSRSG